jgi:hypothetical protein
MALRASCLACPHEAIEVGSSWSCPEHGRSEPLWRPVEAGYADFVDHLETTAGLPTYLPWPLSPGWRITDFAALGPPGDAIGSMACVSGTSELDGPVDLTVVTEEAGAGLGARVAGTRYSDPGDQIGLGPATVRVRIDSLTVSLWPVSVSDSSGDLDRSVVAGEAHGRWLWMVLRPASAILLLRDDWILRDVSGLGPPLVELPFGGPAVPW